MSLAIADTVDMDAADIVPRLELIDSNAALGDLARIDAIYQEQGYLLFRDVLDRGSIDRALRRMMAVMARHGVVAADAAIPRWTGKPSPAGLEESSEFAGICGELVEHPANLAFFRLLLGEEPTQVPIVQYRSYAPGNPISMVHQDGFFSPGIRGFRPVWIPLMTIDREVGGLTLATGHHKLGLVHNLAKPPAFPIPAAALDPDSWATTTFHAGDVLVVHPHMPHVGLANRSDRVRFSIDTRIQSAAAPCVVLGDVAATTPRSVTLRTARGERTFGVSEDTYIRTGENRGGRIPLDKFRENTPEGMRVVVAVDGDGALMIRRAAEG